MENLILTVNKRLSADLRNKFAEEQQKKGLQAWESPTIIPLTTWLKQTFQFYRQVPKVLLNQSQSLILWERVIRESQYEALLQVNKTAELAQQTWEQCLHWGVDISNTDSRFYDWAIRYQAYCTKLNVIDESSLLGQIIELIKNNQVPLSPKIYFAGFDHFSTQLKELVDVLKEMKEVEFYPFPVYESSKKIVALPNQEGEMLVAARWLSYQYEKNKEGNFCCVVPNLLDVRDKIYSIFSEVFDENFIDISAGKSLFEYPIIHLFFKILNLTDDELSYHLISHVLRSPYIKGAEEEIFLRAKLDSKLRENCDLYPNPQTLFNNIDCSIWEALWLDFLSAKRTFNHVEKPSAWVTKFRDLSDIFGWARIDDITELEVACLERFDLLLQEFSQLDMVSEVISIDAAKSLLENMAKKTLFQLPKPDAKIQIIGLLESTGLNFDAIWVMGMDNETIPETIQPNPLIPVELQRKLCMQKANPQHELDYAKKIFDRLKQSAKEVVFSYPEFLEDKPLQVSSLLNEVPVVSVDQLSLMEFSNISEDLFEQKSLEVFLDDKAPPVTKDEIIRGGSYVLKAQATCPFKAFAEIRLNATSVIEPEIGFDAADRGTILHEVLACFWKEIRDSKTLVALTDIELKHKISDAIGFVISKTVIPDGSSSEKEFYLLEKQRLKTIIKDWLTYEKKRDDFKVVGIEKSVAITIGGLNLHCRIDRIDQLQDGSHVIIDYKTGKSTPNSWFGERPDEPQLPLYCTFSTLSVKAVAFAECRANSQQFKGISIEQNTLLDVKPVEKFGYDWEALISEWHQNLNQLANDFLNGEARVDPKHPVLSCQFCELDSLCRIR